MKVCFLECPTIRHHNNTGILKEDLRPRPKKEDSPRSVETTIADP